MHFFLCVCTKCGVSAESSLLVALRTVHTQRRVYCTYTRARIRVSSIFIRNLYRGRTRCANKRKVITCCTHMSLQASLIKNRFYCSSTCVRLRYVCVCESPRIFIYLCDTRRAISAVNECRAHSRSKYVISFSFIYTFAYSCLL